MPGEELIQLLCHWFVHLRGYHSTGMWNCTAWLVIQFISIPITALPDWFRGCYGFQLPPKRAARSTSCDWSILHFIHAELYRAVWLVYGLLRLHAPARGETCVGDLWLVSISTYFPIYGERGALWFVSEFPWLPGPTVNNRGALAWARLLARSRFPDKLTPWTVS